MSVPKVFVSLVLLMGSWICRTMAFQMTSVHRDPSSPSHGIRRECKSMAAMSHFVSKERRPSTTILQMGLYDHPLPPRPPPPEEDDDDFIEESSVRLFSFDTNGNEINNLLPSLGRRLDKGVDCYFEPSDGKVRNLVEKTGCHVRDACWALEACRGEMTEAWTRISAARRMQLDNSTTDDWDELAVEERFRQVKAKRKFQQEKRKESNYFQGGKPDENWLPTNNPKPNDDEPWYTG